jgi:hypothetical protein
MSESLFPTRWAEDRPPSLEKFTSDFADDYACAEYLAQKRWTDGFVCPRCRGNRAWRLETRPWVWECQGVFVDEKDERHPTGCRHQTSLIAGTVMHGTHLPLRKWFLGAYLVATHSNGMSALQLQAKLGIASYKAAWLRYTSFVGLWSILTEPGSREWSKLMKRMSHIGRRPIPSAAVRAKAR